MTEVPQRQGPRFGVTDGEIAAVNLESARRRSWDRLARDPCAAGVAELLVEQEQIAAQFLGELNAFERLEALAAHLAEVDAASARTALVSAQVASATHRFADAREHLAEAAGRGSPVEGVDRLGLAIDQACGTRLDAVLEARRDWASRSHSLEDLVPLAALLADLREFEDADQTYGEAMAAYGDVSPFALAWVYFQRGVLWGEAVDEPQPQRAADWYMQAIAVVPGYVKARVHLAEIEIERGRPAVAESLLLPVLASDDPEVRWRLADALAAQGRITEAERHLAAARAGFERLLERHPLAFADHGAEFYAGSGSDSHRALDLACANVDNRPTIGAYEQAHAIALGAGKADAAADLRSAAVARWGATSAFRRSALASGA